MLWRGRGRECKGHSPIRVTPQPATTSRGALVVSSEAKRLGIRDRGRAEDGLRIERYALKALRGDFKKSQPTNRERA
jgi:hypothetical protein